MEQRKLIKLGNSSFAIALPKNWIIKSGLKKGDKVFIFPNSNGEIIISPEFKKKGNKEIILDLKDKEEIPLQIEILASYLNDYNLFTIKNNLEKKKKQHVKELIKNLMSFEIIEENKEEIKLKDVFSLEESDVETFIRRMDNIIRSFFEDLGSSLKSGKIGKSIHDEMYLSDKEITKLYFLLGRIFMKSLNDPSLLNLLKINSLDLFNIWWFAFNLEKIGDGLKNIATIIEKKPLKSLDKSLSDIFEKLIDNYVKCMNAFYKSDGELAMSIIEDNQKFSKMCENVNQKEISVARIVERLRLVQNNIFQNAKMIIYTNNQNEIGINK